MRRAPAADDARARRAVRRVRARARDRGGCDGTRRRDATGGGEKATREKATRRRRRDDARGLTTRDANATTRAAFGDGERELTAGAKEFKFHHGVEARHPNGTRVGATEEVTRERATVDEKCPKCKHKGLNFYTMQLRSADEGQTVFYECPKCSHTFSQNN